MQMCFVKSKRKQIEFTEMQEVPMNNNRYSYDWVTKLRSNTLALLKLNGQINPDSVRRSIQRRASRDNLQAIVTFIDNVACVHVV